MIFGEKSIVGPEKCFLPSDLMQYVESLIRESKERERRSLEKSNYGWLKAKHLQCDSARNELEELKPLIRKTSSENCAAIAVKLDYLTEEAIVTTDDILKCLKKLLEEKDSIQMIERNIKGAKEMQNKKKSKLNKVHPELLPPGRQATVSFIVESELL